MFHPIAIQVWRAFARFGAAGVLVLLAACSSLPRIVPDMGRATRPVQIDGANGPLSAERTKSILERLSGGGVATSIFDRHLAIEQAIGDSPLVAGNHVELLQNGPATYAAMFAAIDAARDHINMETYILEEDEVGQRFASVLLAKQAQGVQVNLIHDSVGTLGTPDAFFQRLKDGGINVLEFNPVNPLDAKVGWDVNQRDHRKLLVIDGKTAILGGINISSVYSGGSRSGGSRGEPPRKPKDPNALPWRDTDLQITGPVVAEFQKLFLDTWAKQKGDPLAPKQFFPDLTRQGSEVVRAIGGSPDEPYSLIYATLISALQSAETEILLTNAYFAPDPQLLSTLKAAVARGVKVRMILPSRTDSWLILSAGQWYYGELLRAGVQIFERHDALLHAKTAVIDGVWSTVGSTNLDWRSFLHNQEVNAVVLGPEFGDKMRDAFLKDLAASEPVLLEQWERRPLGNRLKESIGRMWEYWL